MTGSVLLDCVMFDGSLSALDSCTQNAVSGFVRFRLCLVASSASSEGPESRNLAVGGGRDEGPESAQLGRSPVP